RAADGGTARCLLGVLPIDMAASRPRADLVGPPRDRGNLGRVEHIVTNDVAHHPTLEPRRVRGPGRRPPDLPRRNLRQFSRYQGGKLTPVRASAAGRCDPDRRPTELFGHIPGYALAAFEVGLCDAAVDRHRALGAV